MASVIFQITGSILLAYLLSCTLGLSRICPVEHQCTRTCYRRHSSSTSCGLHLLGWDRCSKYSSKAYTCKYKCLLDVCCTGYIGSNCDIPIPCNEAAVISDLRRRSRNYKASGELAIDPFINDKNLGPGWFKVGNHTMPDSKTKPKYGHCGTRKPIYVQGNHSKIDVLNETPVSMVVCEVFSSDDCSNPTTVDVRLCEDGLQYYLPETSDQSGYCFDSPALQDIAELDEAPIVDIGLLTVKQHLRFKQHSGYETPFLEFECTETPNVSRSNILYSSYWFVESKLMKSFERETIFMSITEDDLMKHDYKLGIRIRCGISVSGSDTGFLTEMQTSDDFYAGVTVSPRYHTMQKHDQMQITLQPTVPFGCAEAIGMIRDDNTPACKHFIQLYYPEVSEDHCIVDETVLGSLPKINDKQAVCGAEIQGFYAYDTLEDSSPTMSAVTLNITSPFYSKSDPTAYRVGLITQYGGTHKIWKSSALDEIQLTISNGEFVPRVCYAHVDPHMWTFTQREYDINNFAGDFILYKHDVLGIEVQMRTTLCNNNRAYCACAVAVRAGGDVFLINLCGDLRDVGMMSCKDGGTLVIQQEDEYNYDVFTNIGTLVKIKILTGRYKNLLNIDVHLAPKDVGATKGLCDTFYGAGKHKQFLSRSGNSLSLSDFIQEWIVRPTDINLLDKSCDLTVETWQESGQSMYCTCDCFSKGGQKTCGDLSEVVTCSPTQYVNCSISFSKATDFCEYYYEDCDVDRNGKRSASYSNKEAEMKRRTRLSRHSHRFITKRETDTKFNISEDNARELCTNKVVTQMVTEREQLLCGMDPETVIEECTWDVFTGGDVGWADIHQASTIAMIEAGYKRDTNYTLTNLAEFREFKTNACPNNCSGNGNCTIKGKCVCSELYFGPDCAQDKRKGPVIEDITGGGFCDQRYDSECRCFFVQTEALLDSFRCRIVRYEKFLNGETENIGTETTNGRHRNIYNGDCCFNKMRRKRSSDTSTDSDLMNYVYDISISNDGQTFGPSTPVYVYDSLCLTKRTQMVGNVTFEIKKNTCLISGSCQEDNAGAVSSPCYKCKPGTSHLHWTYDCNTQHVSTTAIAIAAAMGSLVLFILTAYHVMCWKKTKEIKRLTSTSIEFNSKMYNEPAKTVFDSKTL